jgi:hypothetical protein
MTSTTLANFLASLAADVDMLEEFNESESNARAMMTQAGLSTAQQEALLEHDVATIHKQLDPDGNWTSEFAVPAGPTKAPPLPTKKFRIIPAADPESTNVRTTQGVRMKPSGTRSTGSRRAPSRSTKGKSTKSKAKGKKTSTQRRRKSTKKGR